jgi:hypothetical protein
MNQKQNEIMEDVLDLAREIEPLQRRINELAEEEAKLPHDEDWDKDAHESLQSWRTYN